MSAIKNRLLLGTILFNIVYWAGAPFVPGPNLSGLVSFLLIAAGIGLLVFYREGFADVLLRRKRDEAEPGAHLSLFGAFVAGFGAVFSGIFNILWVREGMPAEWVGTAPSNYGRIVTAIAFACLVWGPHVGQGAGQWPRRSTIIAAAGIAVLAFVVGTQVNVGEPQTWPPGVWYGADRPVCAPGRKVWGVESSRIYHTEQSRYRNLVVPDRCFHNEWEARAAGYRPPAD